MQRPAANSFTIISMFVSFVSLIFSTSISFTTAFDSPYKLSKISTNGVVLPLHLRENSMKSRFNIDDHSLVLARLARDKARLQQLTSSSSSSPSSAYSTIVKVFSGEYVVLMNVGDPPLQLDLLIDTTSSFTWWQCQPCEICYKQPLPNPIYDPRNSSTFRQVDCRAQYSSECDHTQPVIEGCYSRSDMRCRYRNTYESGFITEGTMGTEILADFYHQNITNSLTFGCGTKNVGGTHEFADASGILGFFPGRYSFPNLVHCNSSFSFCFPGYYDGGKGQLYLNITTTTRVVARLLLGYMKSFGLYYLAFNGIEMDGFTIPIPPEFWQTDGKGNGGVIIDMATIITKLPEKAYAIFKDYFLKSTDKSVPVLPGEEGLDTCFNLTGLSDWKMQGHYFPEVKLVFQSRPDPLDISNEQMIMDMGNGKHCLAVAPGGPTTILGSWILQRTLVEFDLSNALLKFDPRSCDLPF
ncbi:protein ASPARTIC PROTEASE IN GUARD CELL 2 [Ziziphus jujuba]|uniref:Protein ASPARTIC PROTEASE IN GUARD CELL 2 n=1 Tax=Ziziphus jujuba TaxID=326968 RepID=A0A6P4A4Q5_ZIZJJ|nr:protein ASPARTIC PROTEASE IN GUARD CELL 2 [Ziziphus jujuba]